MTAHMLTAAARGSRVPQPAPRPAPRAATMRVAVQPPMRAPAAAAAPARLHGCAARRGRAGVCRALVDELPAEAQAAWRSCSEQVCALGFTPDEADLMLRKAHAWGFQGYWREEKKRETPSPEDLTARLDFLRGELALDDAALRKLLLLFPEALGLDVKQRMRPNVAYLERTYRLSGEALAGVLQRKPQVLGNTLDCAGDCAGECNRCWARF